METLERSEFYPFPGRPGVGLEGIDFDAEPTLLSDVELREVEDFEQSLYDVSLDEVVFPRANAYQQELEESGTPLQSLEKIWKLKINSSLFGVDYFMTKDGRVALRKVFRPEESRVLDKLEGQGKRYKKALGKAWPPAKTPVEMAVVIASLDTGSIDSKVLDKLEGDSVGYEEDQRAKAFKASGFQGQKLQPLRLVEVCKNPETLVAKANGYRVLKAYITKVRADLGAQMHGGDSTVSAAKLILVDKYRKRINGFLADTYVDAYTLLAQHRASGGAIHSSEISKLESILPVFSSTPDNAWVAGFLQRMDRYSHGVSTDEQGNFTWLNPVAHNLALSADNTQVAAADRGIYSDIDSEDLSSTIIDGNTFKVELLAPVLQEYGLLSSSEEWDSERIGPADDDKWQVIVDDKFKSLSVSDKQRVIKVPAKLTSLMAAVSVGNHEITHVLQHTNKRALGRLAILEKVGLENVADQAEAGGMWQERIARRALSGVAKESVAGIGYYKNLRIKAQGGSYGDCVQAYYEGLRQFNPTMPVDKAVAMAVNRARRVFRSGGFEFAQDTTYVTNTQPLNYLEQRLIYEGLDPETRKFLLVGGVTVASLIELRQYGLVDTNNIMIPDQMPWELMYPAVKQLLANQKQTTNP